MSTNTLPKEISAMQSAICTTQHRYIVSTIKANVSGPRYEILDTLLDGGEGEPLIVARFYDKEPADLCASSMSTHEELVVACQMALERFRSDGWPLNEANTAAILKLRSSLVKAGIDA